MSSTTSQLQHQFDGACGSPVTDLQLIAENAYCAIYRAVCDGSPVILKKYHTSDTRLARLEAEGVTLYHSLVSDDPRFTDSRTVAFSATDGVVGMTFVAGGRLADFVYAIRGDRSRWKEAASAMELLGGFLGKLRGATLQPGASFDPFHAEYILYCSEKLERLPVLGKSVFRDAVAEAKELVEELTKSGETPSFVHGDFVFRNVHLDDGRVGLIDFANTLSLSHPLNDMSNLWFAMQNMMLPAALRSVMWRAFESGYGKEAFSPAVRRFFFEFHRRRWLMLNLTTGDPRRWARAARALASFASPKHDGTLAP